jgi:hypothetical protein
MRFFYLLLRDEQGLAVHRNLVGSEKGLVVGDLYVVDSH